MDGILIAGIETVTGANLAAVLSDSHPIRGLSSDVRFNIATCETAYCSHQEQDEVRDCILSDRPGHIIYCSAAARSTWDGSESTVRDLTRPAAEDAACHWARAARELDCRFTMISSDAVFTGPWMFHNEQSACFCDSAPARAIRRIERAVARYCPGALVIRTNTYGWSPAAAAGPGWIDRTLSELETQSAGPFDYLRHATPMLASDLAPIIREAWEARLEGVYHVGGAERVNPNQFVTQLAREFGLEAPRPVEGNLLSDCPKGFGCSETSLHTAKIRKAVGVVTPTLSESLQRLREQKHNGFCERIAINESVACERAA